MFVWVWFDLICYQLLVEVRDLSHFQLRLAHFKQVRRAQKKNLKTLL